MVGGLIINGTESKQVMLRIKGPSMTLKNAVLMPNPWMQVKKYNESIGKYELLLETYDYGDHSSAAVAAEFATAITLNGCSFGMSIQVHTPSLPETRVDNLEIPTLRFMVLMETPAVVHFTELLLDPSSKLNLSLVV